LRDNITVSAVSGVATLTHIASNDDIAHIGVSDGDVIVHFATRNNNQDIYKLNITNSGAGEKDNRKQHFVFSIGTVKKQAQDTDNDPITQDSDPVTQNDDSETQENFFGIMPDEYTYGEYKGGVLYHWMWNSVDMSKELGDVLIQKGYLLAYEPPKRTGGMKWHGTRVEMNSSSAPRYYSVQYFDGNGNFRIKHYYYDK
jgi:hypothetical protein